MAGSSENSPQGSIYLDEFTTPQGLVSSFQVKKSDFTESLQSSAVRGKPDLIKFMGTECLFIIIWWEAGMWEAKLLEGFMESVEAEYRTEMILKWISQRKVL